MGTVLPTETHALDDKESRFGIGPKGERLIFLLGLPRSGTTLLSALLGNHPTVAAPPEPWLMLALHQLGHVGVRHPANAQVLGTAVRRFADGAAGEGEGLASAAREAARVLYNGWLEREQRTHFLDKTPRYHLILDFLLETFPGARFIWLLRDPLDVAASHLTTWGQDVARMIAEERDDPAVFDLLLGLDALERFHERDPSRVYRVRYEDLAASPDAPLRDLLAWLGLSGDTVGRMTDLAGFARPEAAFGDPKILATRSPHGRSIGAWRRTLDTTQRRILLDTLGADRLTRLGYGDTLAALIADGLRDQGSELATHRRTQARRQLDARWSDLDRVATFGSPLPDDVQERVHNALTVGHPGEREPAIEQQLSGMLNDAESRHTTLEQRLAERDREVASLRASTSWRLTAPLRALTQWIRR